jgi:hypothetical protein
VTYLVGIMAIAQHDIYYLVDNAIFKTRIRVDQYICGKMLEFRRPLEEADRLKLEALRERIDRPDIRRCIMALFYRHIEDEQVVNKELKSQAFVYWGDYFSSMMFAAWGTVVATIALVIGFADRFSVIRVAVLLAMIASIAPNLRQVLGGRTSQMLFQIPAQQIAEIHRYAADRLLEDLRKEGFFLGDERRPDV